MGRRILGIVGSYRKDGVIDTLVSNVLSAAEEQGADTEKIYLIDEDIEFCRNCRSCCQETGKEPGECVIADDMAEIVDRYEKCDGLVIGAPVNFFNLNALTRRFMERLVCYAYWPWGEPGPHPRKKFRGKKAVLITSSAMPAFMARIFTGAPRALRIIAKTMGAKTIAMIYAGKSAQQKEPVIPEKIIRLAREAGRKLAA